MKSIYSHAQKVHEIRSSIPSFVPSSSSSPGMEVVSKTEHDILKAQYASLQNQNSSLQAQYNDLQINFRKQLDELLRLSQENLNFSSELDALRHKISVQNSDLMQKSTAVEQQEKQNVELRRRFSDSEQETQNLKSTVTRKNTDIERQLKENADLQQKTVDADREIQNLKDTIVQKDAQFQQQLAQQEKVTIELQRHITDLEVEKQNLKDIAVQKDQNLEYGLKQNTELQCKVDALEKEREDLTHSLIIKDRENADLQDKTLKVKKSIESCEEQLRKLIPQKGNISESEAQSKTTTVDSQPGLTGQTSDEIDSNYELISEIVDSC